MFRNLQNPNVTWTIQKGYQNESEENKFPFDASEKQIFEFKLNLDKLTKVCNSSLFHTILHMPNEMPTDLHKTFTANHGFSMKILFSIKSHKMDDAMKSYSPQIRNCIFDDEIKLKFFKSYTKTHCEFELLIKLTLETCGCVFYWMPREKDIQVCDNHFYYCDLPKIYENFKTLQQKFSCYQLCNDLKYIVEYVAFPTAKNEKPSIL